MLAATQPQPALVRGIDWGAASVYDQTIDAAAGAGLACKTLARWHDVDEPQDVATLLVRLRVAEKPALRRLRETLETIGGDLP